MKIQKYTINADLSVDVNDDVYLYGKNLTEIPVKFNIISGNFNCGHNRLTSLINCPKIINRNFNCSNNFLKSLKGFPTIVNRDCNLFSNHLYSLEHLGIVKRKLMIGKHPLVNSKEYKTYRLLKALRK